MALFTWDGQYTRGWNRVVAVPCPWGEGQKSQHVLPDSTWFSSCIPFCAGNDTTWFSHWLFWTAFTVCWLYLHNWEVGEKSSCIWAYGKAPHSDLVICFSLNVFNCSLKCLPCVSWAPVLFCCLWFIYMSTIPGYGALKSNPSSRRQVFAPGSLKSTIQQWGRGQGKVKG